jgi:hypothetical protein
MSLDEFIEKYKGKSVGYPNDNYFKGECLSLTKWYIKEVFGIDPPASGCNGARCYWSIFPSPLDSIFEKVPNRPDLVPKKGWVAVWDGSVGGGAGHIGIVADDKATKSTFNSFDSNWGSKTAQIVTHNYNNVYGFLVPKGNNMSDMYNGYDLSNRESMKVAVDVLVRVQKGEFVEKSKLDELVKIKTAELSSKISDYEKQIKILNTQIETLKKDVASLNDELEKCSQEVPGQEDLEKDYEITGRKITKIIGDVVIETSYKRKG